MYIRIAHITLHHLKQPSLLICFFWTQIKFIATKEQPGEAKYTKRLMVSGLKGKIQSKILKNVKVYFETPELSIFYF